MHIYVNSIRLYIISFLARIATYIHNVETVRKIYIIRSTIKSLRKLNILHNLIKNGIVLRECKILNAISLFTRDIVFYFDQLKLLDSYSLHVVLKTMHFTMRC